MTKRFGDKGYWWDATCNPRYGDVATFADPHSGYIYAWGGAPTSVKGWVAEQYIYQVRVRPCDAFDLSKYEYWWGRAGGWKRTPLNKFDCETAVMWGTGQGQVVWNPHYGCYIFVHLSKYQIRSHLGGKRSRSTNSFRSWGRACSFAYCHQAGGSLVLRYQDIRAGSYRWRSRLRWSGAPVP